MRTQNPELDKVGLLYSLSEANSAAPIEEAKEYLDAQGIAYTEATGNTNDEVIAAASVLISDGVDAIFTPTDNIVMAAELAMPRRWQMRGFPITQGRIPCEKRSFCYLRGKLYGSGAPRPPIWLIRLSQKEWTAWMISTEWRGRKSL